MTDDRSVTPALASFLRVQESLFGPENIWVYRARSNLMPSRAVRVGSALGLAFFFTGIAWVAASSLLRVDKEWFEAGACIAIVGGLLAFIVWAIGRNSRGHRIKNWRQSCLVLSPGGMALMQGHLKGEMKWHEVVGLKLRKRAAFSTAGGHENGPGLILNIEGATLVIADIYHRPLEHIEESARLFWERQRNE